MHRFHRRVALGLALGLLALARISHRWYGRRPYLVA
jgi:hypothetical protein